jgi:hypothetical protein
MTGRPSTYDRDKADAILGHLCEGTTLPRACGLVGVNRSTFQRWVEADHDGLSGRYEDARLKLLDHWADEIIEIADDGRIEREGKDGTVYDVMNSEYIARSKLRVETRKWLLSKLKPGQYGDRSNLNVTGTISLGQLIDESYKGEDGKDV